MDDNRIDARVRQVRRGRGDSARETDLCYDDPRVPPGQHVVNNWPVLDLGVKPDVALDEWTLSVDGAVEHSFTWTWADFEHQPRTRLTADFHCVTSWSRLDNDWEGVSFRHLLGVARPRPEARYVLFEAYDDYTTNLPLSVCDDDDVLLVDRWSDRPLSRDHGGPVRMIVPKRYAWKGAKWIKRMTFSERDEKGFWEVRGYSNTALPWENDRTG